MWPWHLATLCHSSSTQAFTRVRSPWAGGLHVPQARNPYSQHVGVGQERPGTSTSTLLPASARSAVYKVFCATLMTPCSAVSRERTRSSTSEHFCCFLYFPLSQKETVATVRSRPGQVARDGQLLPAPASPGQGSCRTVLPLCSALQGGFFLPFCAWEKGPLPRDQSCAPGSASPPW